MAPAFPDRGVMLAPAYRETSACEVCGSQALEPLLDLGRHPLCDDLPIVGDERVVATHPQEILLCLTCLTALQRFQVPKETLFPADYHYRSRLTADVVTGMESLVRDLLASRPPRAGAKVLDIGCNDGSLLGVFKQRGLTTVGVDPTDSIREAGDRVDYAYQRYFDGSVVEELLEAHRSFDYIVMTNVFAHIENLPLLCANLRRLIGPETVLVVENHYLGSIAAGGQFDTFYHEHPRTYSVKSFTFVAEHLGCGIESVDFPRRYGGNVRVTMTPSARTRRERLPDEHRIVHDLRGMQGAFEAWRSYSTQVLTSSAIEKPFVGKSLPGRAVMLISSLELGAGQMPRIFEKPGSPKIGHWIPNTRIEVVSDSGLPTADSGDLVIWAWHIADEVLEYVAAAGYRGRVWVPMPMFRMVADFR